MSVETILKLKNTYNLVHMPSFQLIGNTDDVHTNLGIRQDVHRQLLFNDMSEGIASAIRKEKLQY